MNTKDMKAEIARLEAADGDASLPKNTASRLRGLKNALAARLRKAESVMDFRELELNEEAVFAGRSYGTVAKCPVCHELGARRQPKWGNGATIFVHSLEAVPTIGDLIRCGNKFTDSGAHGRFRLNGDFHMVAADGTLVVPVESKAKPKPSPVIAAPAMSSPTVVAGSRRAAALKAWDTIRARRASAAVAAA